MNVEFHYYSTAFLAVKAGFSLDDAMILAYSGQYVDHHHRTYEIGTPRGVVVTGPTQNYSFWDPGTVANVLEPFHFFPAGFDEQGKPPASVRQDGATSAWDVRPNARPVKRLLLEALKTRNLYRIGLALHTFSDSWAHQNFTAKNEPWNRLDATNHVPSPGHAQAGGLPDLWLARWTDRRLVDTEVVNFGRFAEAAKKVYRYLCTLRGKDFKDDEALVAEELAGLVEAGRSRETLEDRMLEFILALNLEPYDRHLWPRQALESADEATPWSSVDHWKTVGKNLLHQVGLAAPHQTRSKPGFDQTHFARWIKAADAHRTFAKTLIREATV